MSLMMLMQFDYLKTPLGGIIAVAAMVDDVASLVILAVIGELQNASDSTTTSDWVRFLLGVPDALPGCCSLSGACLMCWQYILRSNGASLKYVYT